MLQLIDMGVVLVLLALSTVGILGNKELGLCSQAILVCALWLIGEFILFGIVASF